jgi:hypothetical protein
LVKQRSSQVGFEFIGLARDFRRKINTAARQSSDRADALLLPFQARPGFTPMARKDHLVRLAHRWRRLEPKFGRLGRALAELDAQGLRLTETRLFATKLTMAIPSWDADEDAITLQLVRVTIVPPLFAGNRLSLAVIGLHALARRYERGRAGGTALFEDLWALARAFPETIRAAGQFRVAVPGGAWVGLVMADPDGRRSLTVRTFLGE